MEMIKKHKKLLDEETVNDRISRDFKNHNWLMNKLLTNNKSGVIVSIPLSRLKKMESIEVIDIDSEIENDINSVMNKNNEESQKNITKRVIESQSVNMCPRKRLKVKIQRLNIEKMVDNAIKLTSKQYVETNEYQKWLSKKDAKEKSLSKQNDMKTLEIKSNENKDNSTSYSGVKSLSIEKKGGSTTKLSLKKCIETNENRKLVLKTHTTENTLPKQEKYKTIERKNKDSSVNNALKSINTEKKADNTIKLGPKGCVEIKENHQWILEKHSTENTLSKQDENKRTETKSNTKDSFIKNKGKSLSKEKKVDNSMKFEPKKYVETKENQKWELKMHSIENTLSKPNVNKGIKRKSNVKESVVNNEVKSLNLDKKVENTFKLALKKCVDTKENQNWVLKTYTTENTFSKQDTNEKMDRKINNRDSTVNNKVNSLNIENKVDNTIKLALDKCVEIMKIQKKVNTNTIENVLSNQDKNKINKNKKTEKESNDKDNTGYNHSMHGVNSNINHKADNKNCNKSDTLNKLNKTEDSNEIIEHLSCTQVKQNMKRSSENKTLLNSIPIESSELESSKLNDTHHKTKSNINNNTGTSISENPQSQSETAVDLNIKTEIPIENHTEKVYNADTNIYVNIQDYFEATDIQIKTEPHMEDDTNTQINTITDNVIKQNNEKNEAKTANSQGVQTEAVHIMNVSENDMSDFIDSYDSLEKEVNKAIQESKDKKLYSFICRHYKENIDKIIKMHSIVDKFLKDNDEKLLQKQKSKNEIHLSKQVDSDANRTESILSENRENVATNRLQDKTAETAVINENTRPVLEITLHNDTHLLNGNESSFTNSKILPEMGREQNNQSVATHFLPAQISFPNRNQDYHAVVCSGTEIEAGIQNVPGTAIQANLNRNQHNIQSLFFVDNGSNIVNEHVARQTFQEKTNTHTTNKNVDTNASLSQNRKKSGNLIVAPVFLPDKYLANNIKLPKKINILKKKTIKSPMATAKGSCNRNQNPKTNTSEGTMFYEKWLAEQHTHGKNNKNPSDYTQTYTNHFKHPANSPQDSTKFNQTNYPHINYGGNPQTYPGNPQTYPGNPQTCPGNPQTYPGNPQTYPGNPQTCPRNHQTYPGNPQTYPGNSQNYPGNSQNYPGTSQTYPENRPHFPNNAPVNPQNQANYSKNGSDCLSRTYVEIRDRFQSS